MLISHSVPNNEWKTGPTAPINTSWTPSSLYRISTRRARDDSTSQRAVEIAASSSTGPRFVSAPPIRDAAAIKHDDERTGGSAQIGADAIDLPPQCSGRPRLFGRHGEQAGRSLVKRFGQRRGHAD